VAEQDDHSGSGLCLQWHIQFHHSTESSLPIEDLIESYYTAPGEATGCGLSGCSLLLSFGGFVIPSI